MDLPRACRVDGIGDAIYRSTHSRSRSEGYSFWSPDKAYAASYDGDLWEAVLCPDARILDLRHLCDAEGWISAEALDAALPGLAAAMRLDGECPLCDLWELAGDDLSAAAALLREAGLDGFRWVEAGSQGADAYLLVR